MSDALTVTALTDLSTKLKEVDRKFGNSVRKQIRAGVAEAGASTVGRVRSAYSWSSRIPGAVKLTTRFQTKGASVRIIVDHNTAPHARPLEVGNKNIFALSAINALGGYKTVNGRKVAVNGSAYAAIKQSGIGLSRGLRHPVFDSGHPPKRVGEQPTRPSFFPAIAASKAGIDARMEAAVGRAAREAGFN